ncbi:MAG TPA: hypothetical protein VJ951_15550 [Bacteroidales bacterium]|nr:hypothetical protein [Bacteroidales bacterium]
MKTLKHTIDNFASEAMTAKQMNFIKGGGEPMDIIIPPDSDDDSKEQR